MTPAQACWTRLRAGLPSLAVLLLLFALAACATATQTESPAGSTPRPEPRNPLQARLENLGAGPTVLFRDSGLSLNQALKGYYERRNYSPAWSDRGRVVSLVAALRQLNLDGLDPEDYRASEIERGCTAPNDADGGASCVGYELMTSRAYLLALTHLFRGKVDPGRLDPDRGFDGDSLEPRQRLDAALAEAADGDPGAAFDRARPQHPLYAGLRRAMAILLDTAAHGGWPPLPDGPTLRPGDRDPRIPILRRRLVAAGYLPGDLDAAALDNPLFDPTLSAALARYQDEQYLGADGILGRATAAALDVPLQQRIDQLRVNLERARWLLHEVHGDLVVVDIAGYKLHYFQGGDMPAWSTRVQVGLPYRMTPVFKSEIDEIVFNPAWVVPPTIYRDDILPKLRRNRGYLAANHLHVYDAQWHELDPNSIDFDDPPPGLHLRQEAGPHGALGRIKINFPNPYAVYLHGTPHAELFGRRERAFSSGCIRVQDPYSLAERLFDDPEHWNRAAIDAAVAAGDTRAVKLDKPVPVLLAYWTVDLYEGQRVAFKPDVYGLDGAVLEALKEPVEIGEE